MGGIFSKDSNFEIKSDGSHCYYLCKKMIHQNDAEFHCEYTNRKDRVFSLQDLEHSCIPPAGDIRNYGNITSKEDSETDLNDVTKQQSIFAGKYNLSMSSVTSKEFYTLIDSAIKIGQQNPESNPSSLSRI